jgi:hypothetical protein
MNKGHSLLLCFIEQEKRGEKEGVGVGTKQGKCSVLCWSLCVCVCVYLYEVGWYCLYFGSLLGLNHLLYILSHADFLMGD